MVPTEEFDDLKEQIHEIINRVREVDAKTLESVAIAKLKKKRLALLAKEIQQLKKLVAHKIKAIKSEYEESLNEIDNRGSISGLVKLFAGREAAADIRRFESNSRKIAKGSIKSERDGLIEPYESLKKILDELVMYINQLKLNIDNYILEQENNK